jgi:hypothetical protein
LLIPVRACSLVKGYAAKMAALLEGQKPEFAQLFGLFKDFLAADDRWEQHLGSR